VCKHDGLLGHDLLLEIVALSPWENDRSFCF
jgi:hypothetical protein